jgi:hypothetical protein
MLYLITQIMEADYLKLFPEESTKWTLTSYYDKELEDQDSVELRAIFNFHARNREISYHKESRSYKVFEQRFIEFISEIHRNHPILELVYPPVYVHRNMRKPGVYKFESEHDLGECLKDGLCDTQQFRLYMPEFKIILENGHDLYFTISHHKNETPNINGVNYMKKRIKENNFMKIEYDV